MNILNIIGKIIKHIFTTNWIMILLLIFFNLIIYILRLITYRGLTEFISGIVDIGNGIYFDPYYYLVNLIKIFMTLITFQIMYSYSYFHLEKIVIGKIKTIFHNLVSKMMYYKIEFFKNNNNQKINQLWFYLSSIEVLIEKVILEFPTTLAFLAYYCYTIYSFSLTAILLLVPINLLCVYLLHPLSRKQYIYQQERINLDLETKNKLLEATANVEYVKLSNKQSYEINRVLDSYNNYIINKTEDKKITSYVSTISEMISDSLTIIIYYIGIPFIIGNQMKPIELLYLAVHTGNFYFHTMKLKDIYNYYKRIYPKIKVIYDIINYDDTENILVVDNNEKLCIPNNGIVFDNVTFSYDGKTDVIKNLSFAFNTNNINLLLGPNGSGKSTIVKLLLRLYQLENIEDGNKIYYKGQDIKSYSLLDLRNDITFVSQEPAIFNDTIWKNIVYGNETVPTEKIMKLCEMLDSKEWIEQVKDKITGFRGKDLSGGEKKKIQLINAICRDTNVIIFDEPSNALDSNAIKWFINFIQKLKDEMHKTVIIITHDLRLKKVADNIVDLNDKKIC